jgi:hypothetical protein
LPPFWYPFGSMLVHFDALKPTLRPTAPFWVYIDIYIYIYIDL